MVDYISEKWELRARTQSCCGVFKSGTYDSFWAEFGLSGSDLFGRENGHWERFDETLIQELAARLLGGSFGFAASR